MSFAFTSSNAFIRIHAPCSFMFIFVILSQTSMDFLHLRYSFISVDFSTGILLLHALVISAVEMLIELELSSPGIGLIQSLLPRHLSLNLHEDLSRSIVTKTCFFVVSMTDTKQGVTKTRWVSLRRYFGFFQIHMKFVPSRKESYSRWSLRSCYHVITLVRKTVCSVRA